MSAPVYRLSDRAPEGEWWWMWDNHMRYWQRWRRGWCHDELWTHWSPDAPTAPAVIP